MAALPVIREANAGICRLCGDYSTILEDRVCRLCRAARQSVVPAARPSSPFTEAELDGWLGELRVRVSDTRPVPSLKTRMLTGQERYGGSFNEVDLKEDTVEEGLDLAAYPLLMCMRLQRVGLLTDRLRDTLLNLAAESIERVAYLRRVLPSFEGPTSNEWVAGSRLSPTKV